jgi:AcrR family transcriptional regulator
MRKERSDARETRRRILSAASKAFAEKGFWEASSAYICEKANVNSAAINYHFGSKENLYVEAWKYAFQRSLDAHPLDGGIGPDSPAPERLRGAIRSIIQRITDPQTHDLDIANKEIANPTGLLKEIIPKVLDHLFQVLKPIVRELHGRDIDDEQVAFCIMSIMSQCFGVFRHMQASKLDIEFPHPALSHESFNIEKFAEHITQFSLAAIRNY